MNEKKLAKLLVWVFVIFLAGSAWWFLLIFALEPQNKDTAPAVILDLPSLKTKDLQPISSESDTHKPQPSDIKTPSELPAEEPPSQLPTQDPSGCMKLSTAGTPQ